MLTYVCPGFLCLFKVSAIDGGRATVLRDKSVLGVLIFTSFPTLTTLFLILTVSLLKSTSSIGVPCFIPYTRIIHNLKMHYL